ncbi:histidine phosphatase family protein [Paracoccus tegillarcae]|uniref:Histidine phosphatase family protein n=1 Tax=Paracoccus tegillarcae TaxID=1529068 RepID=A0A2K9ENT9_9RHOB|nr:histidine phosphatase family protein [Paracoccus tegillarcae]AUH35137.1 histidine phosphatase family protein [Paracoccus tegillarcae]
MTRLFLIRHATPLNEGRLAGRRDVSADCSDVEAVAAVRARLPEGAAQWCSPALRCRMTADALGLVAPDLHQELWEQDYGAWEGLPFDQLPDLGQLGPAELASHRPEGGESFGDMAARAVPRLAAASGDTVVVAHAGTVRAGLSMVVGPAALSFTVAPLSLTVLRKTGTDWSVEAVNLTAAP